MKKYLIPLIFISISAFCLLTYTAIGSYVDENGILREPFFLIPIGFIFFVIGMLTTLGINIYSLFRFKQKREWAIFSILMSIISLFVLYITIFKNIF